MLKMYVRSFDFYQPLSRGIPVGVVVGVPDADGGIHIGWSKCSNKDNFNKELGTEIAVGRLKNRPVKFSNPSCVVSEDDSWDFEMLSTVRRVVSEIQSNPDRYGRM